MARKVKTKSSKKKLKIKVPIVKLFFSANNNNSIVTMTDLEGKVIAWSSAGKMGFKGTKKSTPFAAQKATEEIIEKVQQVGASSMHLVLKGGGMGRDAFLRQMQNTDVQIESIKDVTGFAFGGVTKRKPRRV